MGMLTTYNQRYWMEHFCNISTLTMPTSIKLHLHTGDPGTAGTANEVSGGSYAAQTFTMQWDGTNILVENSGTISFANMPACTVSHWSISDNSSNRIAKGSFSSSRVVTAGSTYFVAPEALTVWEGSGVATSYGEERILKHVFGISSTSRPSTLYLHLHTGDPGTGGSSNEVTGGPGAGYSSQLITFVWDATDLRVENSATVTFTNLPTATLTHWSVSDGTNRLFRGALGATQAVLSGDGYVFEAGAFRLPVID